MNSALNTLCYIQEQTSFEEDYQNDFGYEVVDKGNRFYVLFEAVLQSFMVMNRNKRMYDLSNIMNCINTDPYIQDQLRKNSWMGCIDHPAPMFQGQELTMQYIGNVDPKMTSHYIRKPRAEGNLLVANIQTDSSNKHGMNMAIKIVDGKITPCFSARVFGELTNKNGQPVVNVRKLITYDWVLFPSHPEAEARIKQPLQEATDAFKDANITMIFFPQLAQMAAASSKETEMLCESFGLNIEDVVGVTSTGNSLVIQENANTYVQPITDKFVRAKTKSMLNDWLHN